VAPVAVEKYPAAQAVHAPPETANSPARQFTQSPPEVDD